MSEILEWREPSREFLPGGPETVCALIGAGALYVGDIVQCGECLATVLANGWLRLVARADEPFESLSSAAGWVLGERVDQVAVPPRR